MAEHQLRSPSQRAVRDDMSARAKGIAGPASGALHDTAARLNTGPAVVAQRAVGRTLTGHAAPVVQRHFAKGSDGQMSNDEVQAEIDKHPDLTPDMTGEIWRRHAHVGQKYILANTIRSLKSGAIVPKPPAPEGERTMTRREASGLTNLPHMDSRMLPLFEQAAVSPLPDETVRSREGHLSSPTRRFYTHSPTHTQPPEIVTGHSNTVMGHGPVDAVDYWNDEGHTKPRAENKAHNNNASIYHGLEEKKKSAKSGGETRSRYRSPSPTTGSHPEYYLRSHPNFNPKVPWHSYEDEDAVREGRRYVPPVPEQDEEDDNGPTLLPPPTMTNQPPTTLAHPVAHHAPPPLSPLAGPTPVLNPPVLGGTFQPIHPIPLPAPTLQGPQHDDGNSRPRKKAKADENDVL